MCDEALAGGVWMKQLFVGRDVAVSASRPGDEPLFKAAKKSSNFMYLVGDAATRECVAVDACWDVRGLVDFVRRHKFRLVGAIATHYHLDHIGGRVPDSMRGGMGVPAVPGFKARAPRR